MFFANVVLIFSRLNEILGNFFRMSDFDVTLFDAGSNPSGQTRIWEIAGTSHSPFNHEFYSLRACSWGSQILSTGIPSY